jgi:hypothetical protein
VRLLFKLPQFSKRIAATLLKRKEVKYCEEDFRNHSSCINFYGFCCYRMPEAGGSEACGRVGNNVDCRCISADRYAGNGSTRDEVVSG